MDKSFLKVKIKEMDIVNVENPELFREQFPYTEVPRIKFDHLYEKFNLPDEIWITDTTFRDGQQAMPPYSVNQIIKLFDLLHDLSGPKGIIKSTEFFLYSDKDKEAIRKCMEKNYQFPIITGWIRADKNDFELVKKLGLKETGILTSCSDYHIFLKLGSTRKKILDKFLGIVKEALANNIIPRCHFEDITRADIYGFVIPFAQKLMALAKESKMPVKIRLCDTLGLGISYPGVKLPRSIPKLANALIHEADVPSEWMAWHGHNDFHKVHINSTSAWLYGICGADGSLLGFGERTGNSPIEGLIMEYIGLKGDTSGIDTTVITKIGDFYRKNEVKISNNQPFIGKDFNVTRAGIHADGFLKDAEIYTIFDTMKILKIPVGIGITDKSGTSGIAFWINSYFDLPDNKKIDKHHPGVIKIHKWVTKEYEQERITIISDQELELQAKKYITELFESEFDEIKNRVKLKVTDLIQKTAVNPALRSENSNDMENYLQKIITENPFIQLITVTDTEGKRLTNNITQVEDKYKYDTFVNVRFHDRPWFINTIKTGKTYISDFYTSKVTNTLCITVATPVFDIKDENVIGVLEFDIKFENAAKM